MTRMRGGRFRRAPGTGAAPGAKTQTRRDKAKTETQTQRDSAKTETQTQCAGQRRQGAEESEGARAGAATEGREPPRAVWCEKKIFRQKIFV